MKFKALGEYFIAFFDGKARIKHVFCGQGMEEETIHEMDFTNMPMWSLPVDSILNRIEYHHDQFHKDAEEETAECAGGCR